MPLRTDLLTPIPGDNPSGKNLRYDRVIDQIKEARTEEDSTLPAGAWERQAKRADSKLVLKLAAEVLTTRTKDLQVAVWLGEAHIKTEGAAIVEPVLRFLLEMQKEFWPTLYPEIDEGDVGLRAVPLQWAANRYAVLVYDLPLTRSGVTFHVYKAARAIGYEEDAANNDARRSAREAAVARGLLTAEDLDGSIAGTSKAFYALLNDQLQSSRDALEDLAVYSEEQYGDDAPSYRKLRDSLDEVHNLVNSLLADKRRLEPDPVEAEPTVEEVASEPDVAAPAAFQPPAPMPVAAAPESAPASVPTVPGPSRAQAGGGTPTSWETAEAQVHACALYMSGERPGSAVPYLLHTAIRWGELRREGPRPPLEMLVPPRGDVRTGLKLAAAEKNWSTVLKQAMTAVAEPPARCWMDLHRYIWTAAAESGYLAFAESVISAVRGFLGDFPEVASWTFADDTPVANPDTVRWLAEDVAQGATAASSAPAAAVAAPPAPPPVINVPAVRDDGGDADGGGMANLFAQAAELAGRGQLNAAMGLLAQDAMRQNSGRMRYRRRVEIAELCLASGSPAVALPILKELVAEGEQRNLEAWEAGDVVARPVTLLLQSMNGNRATPEWQENFARLCRLDPAAALSIPP